MRVAFIKDAVCTHVLECAADWQALFPNEHGVVSDTANVGDAYDGEKFSAPLATALTKSELLAYASTKRWQVEIAGITVSGIPVATDRQDRALLYEAETSAREDASFTTTWIAADGSDHAVDAATVIEMAAAVRAHVAACFSAYSLISSGIQGGTITTAAGIDAAGWPIDA